MKRIGFIYKYNPSEGLGILVFGVWKVSSHWGTMIKNTPILFSANDLLSDVSTGQLVYFDYDGNTASNIERASLSNFKVEWINNIIKCKNGESESSFYIDNTFISFERLDNIIIPNKEQGDQAHLTDNNDVSLIVVDDLFDLVYGDSDVLKGSSTNMENDLSIIKEDTNHLSEPIVGLFNCFGKYKHKDGKESLSLNVFDLSLWIDSDILSTEYYGKKVDELLFLYEVFVLKKRYDRKGIEIEVNNDNDCISPKWSLLLSKFDEKDLRVIINYAPKLQPALPVNFCRKNVDVLTDDYGMPNVEICRLYCLYNISRAKCISDYKELKQKLYIYRHCTAKHLEDEGTPMCKMGKIRIENLEKRLEEQYENVIKKNVIAQLSEISEDTTVVDELRNATPDEFNNVATFIESYNKIKSNFLEYDYDVDEKVLDSYEKLPQLYKDALKTSLLNCVNGSAISATQSEELTPFKLGYHINRLGDWILESTKQQIKELVNDRFSKLDDLEELSYAYEADYITRKQYYYKYTQITKDFDIHLLLNELCDYRIRESPIDIQWYVVSNIIKLLGYESLNSSKYVKVEYMDSSISDIRSLLKWLANYGHLKDVVLKKAEEKICSVLSNEERWTLFEEKIVQSPGMEIIRNILDIAYQEKYENKELFKYACFQDVMLSDVDSIKDTQVLLFIADNLDAKHQYLMQQKATGFLKLYLWQKQPSANYDWNLIKSHFHELIANAQIRTLRYLFGKMASGELTMSLDDLYSEFVETTTPACSAICGILFMLKAKKSDMNVSITPSMLESVIGKEEYQRKLFLSDSKELFYPCNGYLAISGKKQDIEYQLFNGVLTKENKNDELYYVINFYDSPVNLFGRTIEWLDSEYVETAEQVLLRNISVDVINGKYYIHESYEFFVKQFVIAYDIEDRCGLVSHKGRMIELGWLPRNNAIQPLYTNWLKKYEDSNNYICRGGCFGSSDSSNNGIPFFWCKKKMCVRRAHFLLPPSKWEKYRFADLLFIVLGQSPDVRESVWRVNGEVSQFICDYLQVLESNERNICSKPLEELEERGIWDEKSSIYRDIYDSEDDEYGNDDNENYSTDWDEPTYDKYNGSYAQDEMGYSDDDIDTIFDGEPDAYWNID